MKYYYYVETSSPYCGTDTRDICVSSKEIEFDEDEMRQDIFDSYGYLINGWHEEDPTEEEEEEFKADCTVIIKSLTEEEFLQYIDEGYDITYWD